MRPASLLPSLINWRILPLVSALRFSQPCWPLAHKVEKARLWLISVFDYPLQSFTRTKSNLQFLTSWYTSKIRIGPLDNKPYRCWQSSLHAVGSNFCSAYEPFNSHILAQLYSRRRWRLGVLLLNSLLNWQIMTNTWFMQRCKPYQHWAQTVRRNPHVPPLLSLLVSGLFQELIKENVMPNLIAKLTGSNAIVHSSVRDALLALGKQGWSKQCCQLFV